MSDEILMIEKTNPKDILPCPFCGKRGYLERQLVPRRRRSDGTYLFRYYVHCKYLNCGVKPSTPRNFIKAELAINAWNQRN